MRFERLGEHKMGDLIVDPVPLIEKRLNSEAYNISVCAHVIVV